MKIDDTVALVTGANRGVGEAFVRGLLAAGARKVYAAARDPAKVAVPGAVPLRLDITDAAQVAAAARECGDVSLLVNNAGVAQRGTLGMPEALEVARANFETNVFGTLAVAHAFAPVLGANGGGAMVNMLSVLSWLNIPSVGSCAASKSALWGLTNGLRNELRAQGTLVVGVHAAFIDTEMARGIPAPKITPEVVVRQVIDALEAGHEEVLADVVTRRTKLELSTQRAPYLFEAGRR